MIKKLDDILEVEPYRVELKLKDKINEIIDYLNESEKVFDVPTKTDS